MNVERGQKQLIIDGMPVEPFVCSLHGSQTSDDQGKLSDDSVGYQPDCDACRLTLQNTIEYHERRMRTTL